MIYFLLFIASLLVMVKAADLALHSSSKLAESFKISKHMMGFLLVAGVSVLPETLVSLQSAFQGVPSFGVATLLGSNVADLSLVFVLVLLFSRKGLKVESKILKDQYLYFLVLAVPIAFGYDGHFSRMDGMLMMGAGALFHLHAFSRDRETLPGIKARFSWKSLLLFIASMTLMLFASYATVESGVKVAELLKISPVLVGMLLVGLGTTLPETLFAIKAVRNQQDSLALGDILGTVLTDATIVLGLLALVSPFEFEERLIQLTGLHMLFGAILLSYFMQSGRILKKKEGIFLFVFYLFFLFTELITQNP